MRKAIWSISLLATLSFPIGSLGDSQTASSYVAPVELVLSGPARMPLLRKGRGVTFHAALVNRAKGSVTLIPPHKNWFNEHQLEWRAIDAKGRPVFALPESDSMLWCDDSGGMHMGLQSELLPHPTAAKRKQISDADLVTLQPGESYEITNLADPSFALNFLKRGVYQVTLTYTFDPQRYEMPPGSKNTGRLKVSGGLYLRSNSICVTLD